MFEKRQGGSFRSKALGVAVVLITTLVALVVADFLLGRMTDVGEIRTAAKMFRAEAAPYGFRSLSLVPGTKHTYRFSNGEAQSDRQFYVGRLGEVLGSNERSVTDADIVFMGGSTTESNEVTEGYRFPDLVGSYLSGEDRTIETWNLGVRGHTTAESIFTYLARPGLENARFVVLMHNINDRLWLSKFGDYAVDLPKNAPTTWQSVTNDAKKFVESIWDYLSYRSNTLFLLRQKLTYFNPWTGESNRKGIVTEENVDVLVDNLPKIAGRFRTNLRSFIALVMSRGSEPVLMTQPLGHASTGQSLFNEIIREVATESGVLLVDLAQKLGVGADAAWLFLGDGIHLNDEGSKAVALEVSRVIAAAMGIGFEAPAMSSSDSLAELLSQCKEGPSNLSEGAPSTAKKIIGNSARYPSFSQDGNWMVFQTWQDNLESIYALNLLTGKLISLTPEAHQRVNERHPAVISSSPDELEVVFGSGYDSNDRASIENLKIRRWPSMSTDNLLVDKGFGASIPAVRDGTAYFAGYGVNPENSVPNLYKIDLKDSRIERLTFSDAEQWRPAPSPNGEDLFYIERTSDGFDIFKKQLIEKKTTKVWGSSADEWDPALSPDGSSVVFATRESGRWALKLVHLADGQTVSLTGGVYDDWDPAFHPSGKLIAFARSFGQEPYLFGLCLFGENSGGD